MLRIRVTPWAQWYWDSTAGPELTLVFEADARGAKVAAACLVRGTKEQTFKEAPVLWTIFVILVILWLLGMVSSYTIGGYIHLLLIVAVVIVLIRVIQGRRPL
jgi:hypothetical protein